MHLDDNYHGLVNTVLNKGVYRQGRNGGVTSLFGATISHDMLDGFPLITSRRIFYKGVFGELAGFLEGATSVSRFKELGCNYWDFNAGKSNYLGRIYGAQWRDFRSYYGGGPPMLRSVDQLVDLISGLKSDPHSRRHILTTWQPAELDTMCLPPCHLLNQYWVNDDELSSIVYMRSVDLCLGLPSDLALYGLLLELVAKEVGMIPTKLTFMLGDAHIYENHKATWLEQDTRLYEGKRSDVLLHRDTSVFRFKPHHATIINYEPMEKLNYALN